MKALHLVRVLYFALLTASAASQNCASTIVLDRKYVCVVDSDSVPANACGSAGIPRQENCMPSVGMDVTLICSNNATGALYANGMPLGTNVATYQQATAAISGLYECRGLVGNASRLVSVQVQPVIGVTGSCTPALTSQCCGPLSSLSLPVSFNLFCANCTVSLAVNWTNHLPVDLDLVLAKNGTSYSIFRGSLTRTPYAVNSPAPPTALITVLARDQLTSSSVALCFSTVFDSTVKFSASLYAPTQPVMRGDSATTTCRFYTRESYKISLFFFLNFTTASGISYTANYESWLSDKYIIANFIAMVSITRNPQGFETIETTVNLTNISDAYNGMIISCSLLYDYAVQWTNMSRLYVTSPPPPSIVPVATSRCPMLCRSVVTGLLIPTIAISVIVLIVLTIRKLTRQPAGHGSNSGNLEYFPPLEMSSTSTAGNASYFRSNSQPNMGRSDGNRHPKRVSIYVSYSDDKLEWVRDALVPVLRRMIHAEVVLRDDAMVVGQPVSEERLRLLLGADKVLVVCSPEYEASPWCQYELLQAVGRDPGLSEGRVIPILCDGCRTLPAVIAGVVSLKDSDLQFESKLQQSVLITK